MGDDSISGTGPQATPEPVIPRWSGGDAPGGGKVESRDRAFGSNDNVHVGSNDAGSLSARIRRPARGPVQRDARLTRNARVILRTLHHRKRSTDDLIAGMGVVKQRTPAADHRLMENNLRRIDQLKDPDAWDYFHSGGLKISATRNGMRTSTMTRKGRNEQKVRQLVRTAVVAAYAKTGDIVFAERVKAIMLSRLHARSQVDPTKSELEVMADRGIASDAGYQAGDLRFIDDFLQIRDASAAELQEVAKRLQDASDDYYLAKAAQVPFKTVNAERVAQARAQSDRPPSSLLRRTPDSVLRFRGGNGFAPDPGRTTLRMRPERNAPSLLADQAPDDAAAANRAKLRSFIATNRPNAPSPAPIDVRATASPKTVTLEPQIMPDDGSARQAAENLKYAMLMDYAYEPHEDRLSSARLQSSLVAKVRSGQQVIERNRKIAANESGNASFSARREARGVIRERRRELDKDAAELSFYTKVEADPRVKWRFQRMDPRLAESRNDPDVQGLVGRDDAPLSAALAAHAQQHGGVWDPATSTFTNPETGNRIAVVLDRSDPDRPNLVLSFVGTGGTQGAMLDRQVKDNKENYLGKVPPSVEEAIAFGRRIRGAVAGYNQARGTKIDVVSIGHSRGGYLAQAEAAANHGRALCGNSAAMGPAVRRRTGMDRMRNEKPSSTQISHIFVRGDMATNSKVGAMLGSLYENVSNRPAPRTLGRAIQFNDPGRLFYGRHDSDAFGEILRRHAENALEPQGAPARRQQAQVASSPPPNSGKAAKLMGLGGGGKNDVSLTLMEDSEADRGSFDSRLSVDQLSGGDKDDRGITPQLTPGPADQNQVMGQGLGSSAFIDKVDAEVEDLLARVETAATRYAASTKASNGPQSDPQTVQRLDGLRAALKAARVLLKATNMPSTKRSLALLDQAMELGRLAKELQTGPVMEMLGSGPGVLDVANRVDSAGRQVALQD